MTSQPRQLTINHLPIPLKMLLRRLPIHHVPDLRQVLLLIIEVLQIIRVLPHIYPQHNQLPTRRQILIFTSGEFRFIGILVFDEPHPSGPLDREGAGFEGSLEGVETAPAAGDCGVEGGRVGGDVVCAAGGGGERLPEQSVVDVSSRIEFDGGLQFELLDEVGGVEGVGVRGEGVIQVGDVGLVVAVVVQVHDLPGDGGFEGLRGTRTLAGGQYIEVRWEMGEERVVDGFDEACALECVNLRDKMLHEMDSILTSSLYPSSGRSYFSGIATGNLLSKRPVLQVA